MRRRQPMPSHTPTAGRAAVLLLVLAAAMTAAAPPAAADDVPYYLRDRGPGMSTSLFGTYVDKGQWLVYLFYEYSVNKEDEYHGSELGFTGDVDYLGKSTETEWLVFLSYGITDWFMFELEPAVHAKATLEKAKDDPNPDFPRRIEESGLGDVDMQLRARFLKETESRPELFAFFEFTPGLQDNKKILGTQENEYSIGVGAIKGFHFGTLKGRISVFYSKEDGFEFSEYEIEYLKRINHRFSVVAAIEGEQEDVQAIGELQVRFGHHVTLKLNSGFGVTQKAEDFAPEVGVLFSF